MREKKNHKPNNVIFSRPVYGFPAYSLYGFASVQVGSVRLDKHTFSSAMTGSHLMCKKGRWDIRFLRRSPRLWWWFSHVICVVLCLARYGQVKTSRTLPSPSVMAGCVLPTLLFLQLPSTIGTGQPCALFRRKNNRATALSAWKTNNLR